MLALRPSYWREEILASQSSLRGHLGAGYDRLVQQYRGSRWGSSNSSEDFEDHPENHAFEWLALMMGQAVPGTPQIKAVSAEATGELAESAVQLELAVNEVLMKSRFRREMHRAFVDFGMRWAAVLVKPQPQMGAWQFNDPPNWPQAMRLSLKDVVFDPRALSSDSLRWIGRRVRADKDDVIAAAKDSELGWNRELIDGLAEVSESNESVQHSRPGKQWWGGPDRHQVEWFEVWVPELEQEWTPALSKKYGGAKSWREAGFNGMVLTIAMEMEESKPSSAGDETKDEEWIREPRPYFGPPEGPIELIRGYDVPDEAVPLSNLGAVEAQVEYLNDLVVAMQDSARRWKRLTLVGAEDPELPIKISEGEHDGLFTTNVTDLRKNVQTVEYGGTSNEQIVATDIAKSTLDRISGMDDAQRGNVTGEGTATEVYAAAQASAARVGVVLGNFREGMTAVIRRMCWYIWNDHTFRALLGPEAAARIFHVRTGELRGNGAIRVRGGRRNEKGEPVPMAPNLDAVSVQIHTFAMHEFGTTNPQQQLMEFDQAAMAYLPLTSDPRFLHVDWAQFAADRRRYSAGPDPFASVDFERGREIGMLMLQAQVEPPQAAGPAQPAYGQGSKGGGGPSWRVQPTSGQERPFARAGGLLAAGRNTPAQGGKDKAKARKSGLSSQPKKAPQPAESDA